MTDHHQDQVHLDSHQDPIVPLPAPPPLAPQYPAPSFWTRLLQEAQRRTRRNLYDIVLGQKNHRPSGVSIRDTLEYVIMAGCPVDQGSHDTHLGSYWMRSALLQVTRVPMNQNFRTLNAPRNELDRMLIEDCELLLRHKADIEMKTKRGSTPLMLAAYYGHSSVVKLLIEHQADVNAVNQHGKRAIDLLAASPELSEDVHAECSQLLSK